jgi:hypothetical protein
MRTDTAAAVNFANCLSFVREDNLPLKRGALIVEAK